MRQTFKDETNFEYIVIDNLIQHSAFGWIHRYIEMKIYCYILGFEVVLI